MQKLKKKCCNSTDPEGVSLVLGSDSFTADWEDGIAHIVASTPICKPATYKYSKKPVSLLSSSDDEDPVGISLEGYITTDAEDTQAAKTNQKSFAHLSVIASSSDDEDPVGISLECGPGYKSTDEEDTKAVQANPKSNVLPYIITSEMMGSVKMKAKALQIELISDAREKKCLCSQSCIKQFAFQEIFNLRSDYWSLPRSKKMSFLVSMVKDSKYYGKKRIFTITSKELCTKGFLNILRINKNTLSKAVSLRNRNSETASGKRPRQITSSTIGAINFIDWYAKYYGDKMPHTTEVLIPYKTSKKLVYEQYLEKRSTEAHVVSLSQFLQVWKRRFQNVKIRKTSTFSKCSVCTGFERELEKTRDSVMRCMLQRSRHEHLDRQMLERAYYYGKREASENDPESIMSIIIDGMDQSKTSLPHFAGRLPKFINAGDLMKCHITGVLNHGEKKFHTFVDYNQYSHDPNLTINVILKILQWTSKKQGNRLPGTLYVQADNCFRENRNKAVLAFLELLTRERIFNEVHISFLMVGHTHEDVDAGFSRISESLRKKDSETIPDLLKTIRDVSSKYSAEKLTNMLDIKSFLLKHTNNLEQVSQPLHFKFVSSASGVNVFSKGFFNDDWTKHQHTILYELPIGKPAVLEKGTEKISFENIKRVIKSAKHYFKQRHSQLWWDEFLEEVASEEEGFDIQWLETLPRQTDSDDGTLPDHLQQIIGKETEKRPMIIRKRRGTEEVNTGHSKRKSGLNNQEGKKTNNKKGRRQTVVHTYSRYVLIPLDTEIKRHIWIKIFLDIFMLIYISVLKLCMLIIGILLVIFSISEMLSKLSELFSSLLLIHGGGLLALVSVQTYIDSIKHACFCNLKNICVTGKPDLWCTGIFSSIKCC